MHMKSKGIAAVRRNNHHSADGIFNLFYDYEVLHFDLDAS